MVRRTDDTLRCSFCGKSQNEVKKLIAGPTVYICNECIDICNEIITDDQQADTSLVVNLNYMRQKYNLAPPPAAVAAVNH